VPVQNKYISDLLLVGLIMYLISVQDNRFDLILFIFRPDIMVDLIYIHCRLHLYWCEIIDWICYYLLICYYLFSDLKYIYTLQTKFHNLTSVQDGLKIIINILISILKSVQDNRFDPLMFI
jgi:hypothetical protein